MCLSKNAESADVRGIDTVQGGVFHELFMPDSLHLPCIRIMMELSRTQML